jgi:uncharacterized repeat protein (TIGR01451 family)
MKLSVVRAFFFLLGLALISAGALPGNPRAALAEPAVRIIETSTAEPPTPTNTPIPPTDTPIPPTVTPTTETTPGPAPEPTLTPTPGAPPEPGRPDPTATATPLPIATPELPAEVADPAITKTVDRNTVQVGDRVTFTITVTNLGNSTATDVIVEDTLPPFLALEGVATSRGDFSVEGSTVRVFIGDLAPQEVVTITITATAVALSAPPDNINLATVATSSPTDDPTNNESSVEVNVVAPAPTAVPPPASLPVTGTPGGSAAPWLVGLGMLLVAGSLLIRRRA